MFILIGLDAFLYVYLVIFSKQHFLTEFGTNMWLLINSIIWLMMLLIWYVVHPASFGSPKDKILQKISANKYKLLFYHVLAIANTVVWLYLLKKYKYIELTAATEMLVLIFTVILGKLMLNETINNTKKMGILISMVGIYFIS